MSFLDELVSLHCPEGVSKLRIGEVLDVFNGYAFDAGAFNNEKNGLPLIRIRDVNSGFSNTFFSGNYEDKYLVQNGDLLIGMDGDFRITQWTHGTGLLNQRVCRLQNFRGVLASYILHFLQPELTYIQSAANSGTVNHLSSKQIAEILIPVPPLEVQAEVVSILDKIAELRTSLMLELKSREVQYEHYRYQLLKCEGIDFEELELGSFGRVLMCKRIMKDETAPVGDVPFFKIGTFGGKPDAFITREKFNEFRSKYPFPSVGSLLISAAGTIGRVVRYNGEDSYFQDSNIVWLDHDESVVLNDYLFHCYKTAKWSTDTGSIPRLYNSNILKLKIKVPSLEEQRKIANFLGLFEDLVNDPINGLVAEIKDRSRQYDYYRDRLFSFKEMEMA
jgi:type I restriction enzyme S subunit